MVRWVFDWRWALAAAVAPLLACVPARADPACLLCAAPAEDADAIRATSREDDVPLRIDVTADLDFSRFAAGQGGGSVTLDPRGGSRVAGSISPVGGFGFSGKVVISGGANRQVRISIPAEATLTSGSGRVARLRDIASGLPPVARLGPDGRLEVAFGGRLEVDGAASGDYRGRIPVTVTYE